MKKLNKKGVTIVELIVSFAIVSVALLYFYQTIVDLHRMYKKSTKATDEFVNKDYALRILDAWATKSGNNLDDIRNNAGSQIEICEKYSMFCDDDNTDVEDNDDFKKVTLKDKNEKVEVIYYKYNKSLITEQLEDSGALVDGNITAIEKLNSFGRVSVSVVNNNKINYTIKDAKDEEKYSITNKDTINKIIEDDLEKDNANEDYSKEKITEKVKTIMGKSYGIEEGVGDIGNDEFARVYNVVDSSGNVIAENIYQIDDNILIKITSENAKDYDVENLFELLNPAGYESKINKHINEFDSLKFKLNASTDRSCWAILYNELLGKDVDYYVEYNKSNIQSLNRMQNLINNKKILVQYEKNNENGEYFLTYSKFKNDSATEPEKHYIKVYNFSGEANACKMQLVEAYKYK